MGCFIRHVCDVTVKLCTLQGCYKTCYQRNVIERCGCADAALPMQGKAFGDVTVTACNTSDIVQG